MNRMNQYLIEFGLRRSELISCGLETPKSTDFSMEGRGAFLQHLQQKRQERQVETREASRRKTRLKARKIEKKVRTP